MTTYATSPLSLERSKISKPASRPAEIDGTLDRRFSLPTRATPGSLADLVALVQRAIDEDRPLRVIGAGRGLSAATDPVGTLVVSTEKLQRLYKGHGRDIVGLRRCNGVEKRSIARVQAGAPARSVLRALTTESPPRTLITHGSGDFQSLVGALSTGTHGTGRFPSLAGLVRALVVVRVDASSGTPVPRVELIQRSPKAAGRQTPCYRVPRSKTWKAAGGVVVHAVSDDDTFYAHTVGLGCLGLVYCVTVAVAEKVPLMEQSRVAHRLDELLSTVAVDHTKRGVRCEFIVDPYPRDTSKGGNPKRWDDRVDFPATRDFRTFRGQYIHREQSDAPKPKGNLPLSMLEGRKPFAAGLIGSRIASVLEDPVKTAPKGTDAMIQCSGLKSYIDWLPNILLLNLKYSGTGSEWAVPYATLEDALWELMKETDRCLQAFAGGSNDRGAWKGTDAELETLLTQFAPVYNGPAVRFVRGEGALLAGSNLQGRDAEVPIWTTIEVGFLGRPEIEADWALRKRHAGIRPEETVPMGKVEGLLDALDAADAASPGGKGTWLQPVDLKRVHGKKKRRAMRLFAAYEHGRYATLQRMTDRLCTDAIGARPHQGLYNAMTWAEVSERWPKTAPAWLARFREANPTGTFDNALTDRWGLRALGSGGVT